MNSAPHSNPLKRSGGDDGGGGAAVNATIGWQCCLAEGGSELLGLQVCFHATASLHKNKPPALGSNAAIHSMRSRCLGTHEVWAKLRKDVVQVTSQRSITCVFRKSPGPFFLAVSHVQERWYERHRNLVPQSCNMLRPQQ